MIEFNMELANKIAEESYDSQLDIFLNKIRQEVKRAKEIHKKDFNSVHEGYAVILEELDELWDEVKKRDPSIQSMEKEAVQAAAMLLRFLVELT